MSGASSGVANYQIYEAAIRMPTGNVNITSNGTTNISQYETVTVNVPTGSTINNQNKTITATESQQTVSADSGYTGLGTVTVNAIPSTYIGSGITTRNLNSLTVSGATVNVPAGYYASAASKNVATMTLPTAAASSANGTSKATITPTTAAQYINIPTGYNGTASSYKIDAIPSNYIVPSGNKSITVNGTNIDVKNYATVSVAVPANEPNLQKKTGIDPTTASQTITADSGYDGLESVQINAMPTMTLPTSASSTRSGTTKATIGRSTSAQYINIPVGYNSTAASYTISAVANGSATAPASISGTSATVSTGTNTLTLTKSVSVTPSVTAGYISSGTAGNSSVSLTASVTTKAAATITPGTSNQTIASGTYLTGTQTISGDADLVAANIKSGVTIFNISGTFTSDATAAAADIVNGETAYVNGSKVTGSLVINKYYEGSSAPSSSLGNNGDIYIQQ